MNIEELTEQIDRGDWDEELAAIKAAVRNRMELREEARDTAMWYTLKQGDTVAFNSHCRPKYMQGLTAKVVKRNPRKIVVRLTIDALEEIKFRAPQSAHKWRGNVTCPVAILHKVDAPSTT